jgi:acetyl esterase/lipase
MPNAQTVTYRRAGEVELQMDVYTPDAGAGLRPGVLFIHGGGWSGGKRSQFTWHAQELAKAGFVTASASYRLAPVHPYPAALDDCQAALRWLRKHAEELRLDPARVGAFGSSAGGHLAACLGVRDTRLDDDPALSGVSSQAQCVVDVHGVHDFTVMTGAKLHSTVEAFLGGPLAGKPEIWKEASPLGFVNADTAPLLLVHAPDDPTVPYDQSTRLADALMAAARPFEFMPTPGSGHGFVYSPENPWTLRVWPRAVAWLTGWLKPGRTGVFTP